ncbi:hypothetical protein TPHA_0C00960 [Tetrapisispora phaffii CBS 4417]|uniref:Metal resistance protein YCF1 n=1 Tax=Tetrapisispora phaffii (strain ATCC 24235 / CBS 4417 / NBRC 1672 / NRRL Y-8282 / UCD 70-5) TaxID=1071381 RepID=G8BR76_TETPH|nr:hypothetical protein TPHA_0C00960 [Tetrapisispora phaffii CBS 4417]CCE62252.1 hypothetical protein TPHA_0C00960 [Tetrapisispora phaffii CBS 4417]
MSSLLSDICQFCHSKEGWGPISKYGDFTQCFIDGVLLNLASLFMIIFGTVELVKLIRKKHPGIKYRQDWLIFCRITLVLLQIVLTGIASLSLPHHKTKDMTIITQYSLSLMSLFVVLALHWIEFHRSKIANGVVLFYWLFEVIGNGVKVVNFWIRYEYENKFYFGERLFILVIFQTIVALSILLLEAIPQKKLKSYQAIQENLNKRKENPYDSANIFSRISFSWMTSLMKTGYEVYLTESDLYKLPSEFNSEVLSTRFNGAWQDEVKHKAKPSIVGALAKTFGPKLLLAASLKFVHDILAFVQPQLLRILIQFVNAYSDSENEGSYSLPIIKGFMIAIAMFSVSLIQTSFLHQYFLNSFNSGMNIRSALTSVIYQKALLLSNEATEVSTTGDIVNLMSVDVQRLQDLSQWINILWSGPFQLTLCLISLYNLLGHSMWIGVFILGIMIPINSYIMRIQKKLQKDQMKYKDERTGLVNEILNNIKSLKLYAWEKPFQEKLEFVRNEKELKNLKKIGVFNAMIAFQFNIVPFLVSCCTFAIFVWVEDKPLTTDLVFPALTLFNLLNFPLVAVPITISAFIEASVSISRLYSYLTNEELQKDAIQRLPFVKQNGETTVKIGDNATFLWKRKPEYKVALKNINFEARKGELACIVGKVGSGKSAFIQSILGDLFRVKGFASIHGNVAYVSQLAWIMNGTVKDNIIFGHRYDPEFYEKTIKACALTIDLSILPDGDQTLVGEKGISLSGGQKARLSLARAVYARADIYLLDDPLAAVDEHVSKHLIQNVLGAKGLLKSKTRILTTNKIPVLSIADSITLLENGEITEQGTYFDVMATEGSSLSKLITEYGKKKDSSESEAAKDNVNSESDESSVNRELTVPIEDELRELDKLNDLKFIDEGKSLRRASFDTLGSMDFNDDENSDRREFREQGKVKWSVYIDYARSCNPRNVLIFISFIIIAMFFSVMGNVWLKHWSEVNTVNNDNSHAAYYLFIYFTLGFASSLANLIQTIILWIFCTIQGSKQLHSSMTSSIFRAPMSFFETTPIGRILNRFSNDVYKIDEILGRSFSQFFQNTIRVSFTIVVICSTTWQFIFLIIPMAFLYIYYQQYFLRTSRELRRLDSTTRSPLYAHFQETLCGVSTIRGFAQQDRFIHINQSRVDSNMMAYYPSINSNRWLAFRLEFLGSLIILGAATLSIFRLKNGSLTAGMIGLSMSYALQVTQSLNWIVRMTVDVESNIVSVERIEEYSHLPSEAPLIIENNRPSEEWPSKGAIEFKNYSTRYRPELDLVLKNINLKILPKEKVGIVGRTGAGKSSLTLALFRIIEASSGSIEIDGVNINELGLYDLRHKLSIIPQDSQVFEGSIRENIDPTQQFSEQEIWNALEMAHLKPHILKMNEISPESENSDTNQSSNPLDAKITEGGSNLSVGQRQLICLARALLVPSNVLILDEATAAVDVETDELIQHTIRTAFKDRTILTIAHRINTIMDSDKIIVLDNGEVAEFDKPEILLTNKNSLFYSLCYESGVLKPN